MARGLRSIGYFRQPAEVVEFPVRAGVLIARTKFKQSPILCAIPAAYPWSIQDYVSVARTRRRLLSSSVPGRSLKALFNELCIV